MTSFYKPLRMTLENRSTGMSGHCLYFVLHLSFYKANIGREDLELSCPDLGRQEAQGLWLDSLIEFMHLLVSKSRKGMRSEEHAKCDHAS